MKHVLILLNILMLLLLLNSHAFAASENTFTTNISTKGFWTDNKAEKAQQLCYRLAAQGKFVRNDTEKSPWFSEDDFRIWRVTRLSSGMKCREMVVGGHDRQYGSNDKIGCTCEGAVEISK